MTDFFILLTLVVVEFSLVAFLLDNGLVIDYRPMPSPSTGSTTKD